MTSENILTTASQSKPRAALSSLDHEKLSALAHAARNRLPDLAAGLADQLGRAHVLADGELSGHFVRMHSEVEFRDDATGKIRTVTIVYPEEADISQGKISVMTPVGTALIGSPLGHSITWETLGGEARQLTVLSLFEPLSGGLASAGHGRSRTDHA